MYWLWLLGPRRPHWAGEIYGQLPPHKPQWGRSINSPLPPHPDKKLRDWPGQKLLASRGPRANLPQWFQHSPAAPPKAPGQQWDQAGVLAFGIIVITGLQDNPIRCYLASHFLDE
jgi:hypothetical protein